MSDRARGLFARERGGLPFGRAAADVGRGIAGLMGNAVRMGVGESDGEGKEGILEVVGLWWKKVAILVGRIRVGVAAPVAGVNFESRADA